MKAAKPNCTAQGQDVATLLEQVSFALQLHLACNPSFGSVKLAVQTVGCWPKNKGLL